MARQRPAKAWCGSSIGPFCLAWYFSDSRFTQEVHEPAEQVRQGGMVRLELDGKGFESWRMSLCGGSYRRNVRPGEAVGSKPFLQSSFDIAHDFTQQLTRVWIYRASLIETLTNPHEQGLQALTIWGRLTHLADSGSGFSRILNE
jgi:hypothetical protein